MAALREEKAESSDRRAWASGTRQKAVRCSLAGSGFWADPGKTHQDLSWLQPELEEEREVPAMCREETVHTAETLAADRCWETAPFWGMWWIWRSCHSHPRGACASYWEQMTLVQGF